MPEQAELWRKTGQEAFRLPATRGLKKDSDRAITPVAEAVDVSEDLAPPESPQPKQLYHLHTQPSMGQSYHWQILCLCIQDHSGRVQLFVTLWTVACQASLPGGFSRQEYWSVLANTGCHSLLEHSISCCPSRQLP